MLKEYQDLVSYYEKDGTRIRDNFFMEMTYSDTACVMIYFKQFDGLLASLFACFPPPPPVGVVMPLTSQ